MRRLRRRGAHALLALMALQLLAGCSTGRPAPEPVAAAPEPPPRYRVTLARSPLPETQQIVHVLNRLGYGPRPGDVERVTRQGLNTWIERQLDPGRIADDSLETMLGAFPVLAMSAADLYRDYPAPRPEDVQRFESGQMTPQEIRETFPRSAGSPPSPRSSRPPRSPAPSSPSGSSRK